MDVLFFFDEIWNVKYFKFVDVVCMLIKIWVDCIIGCLNVFFLLMELLIKVEGLNVENLLFY